MRQIHRYNVHDLTRMCEFMLDGEPVFILRAQDKLAIAAVDYYLKLAMDEHADVVSPTRKAMAVMMDWQTANSSRVKRPDY